MEGPSSRLNEVEAGPRKLATRQGSGGDSDPDAAGDLKTHFRVCRFMMETGQLLVCVPGWLHWCVDSYISVLNALVFLLAFQE